VPIYKAFHLESEVPKVKVFVAPGCTETLSITAAVFAKDKVLLAPIATLASSGAQI